MPVAGVTMGLTGALARLVRCQRFGWRRWSSAGDRAFHDTLYRGQDYDPFALAYPGYVTIRRFADLAEEHLGPDIRLVLDVGCGPGEITCELARRHPEITFLGVELIPPRVSFLRSRD